MIALKLSWPVLVKDLKATIHGVHSDGPNIFPSSSILTFLQHQLHLVLRRGLGGKLGQKLRSSLQLDPEVPGKRCVFVKMLQGFLLGMCGWCRHQVRNYKRWKAQDGYMDGYIDDICRCILWNTTTKRQHFNIWFCEFSLKKRPGSLGRAAAHPWGAVGTLLGVIVTLKNAWIFS